MLSSHAARPLPRRLSLPGALMLLASACARDAGDPTRSADLGAAARVEIVEDSAFEAEVGQISGYNALEHAERRVIRDRATWEAFWARAAAFRTPRPAAPAVDFERHMIVVVGVGPRPSGGYTVFIERVSHGLRGLDVRATSASPGAECGVTLSITSPLHAVLVPRSDDDAVFDVREVVRDCR